jgi:hypothetical protein
LPGRAIRHSPLPPMLGPPKQLINEKIPTLGVTVIKVSVR